MEEKYRLMSKILEAEQEAKWQSMVQCEEHEQRIQFLEKHVSTYRLSQSPCFCCFSGVVPCRGHKRRHNARLQRLNQT